MNLKKHIPNAITCGNLFCGCLGIIATNCLALDKAFYFLILAAILDFFDGFAARLLKVSSVIGKDLDSLADMVTFGVLPGFIMYKMLGLALLNFNKEVAITVYSNFSIGEIELGIFEDLNLSIPLLFIPFLAFIITVFSAIRLAKFNNDIRQSDSFIGLPTPANGLLISAMGYILMTQFLKDDSSNVNKLFFSPITLIIETFVLSFLLIAPLPLFSLKFKHFKWQGNQLRFVFLALSLVLLITLQFIGIPLIIILYILLSVVAKFV